MTSLAVRSDIKASWPLRVPNVFLSEVDNTDADYIKGYPEIWAVLRYGQSAENRISIGSPGQTCFRETGTIAFRVYTKAGIGSIAAFQQAEAIKSAYRDYIGLSGYLLFTVISPPVDLNAGESEGMWYASQVEANYTYEYHQ
jgi:hypothetical protein